jgi:hypothetical protein
MVRGFGVILQEARQAGKVCVRGVERCQVSIGFLEMMRKQGGGASGRGREGRGSQSSAESAERKSGAVQWSMAAHEDAATLGLWLRGRRLALVSDKRPRRVMMATCTHFFSCSEKPDNEIISMSAKQDSSI